MSIWRPDARRDANEKPIRQALHAVGIETYKDNPVDLICICGGAIALVEVKTKNGKLTASQEALIAKAEVTGAPIYVVRSMEEAVVKCRELRAQWMQRGGR